MTAKPQSDLTNRLIHETSPYLLQHARNPVDWYPWGQEALGRAQAEGKPILLSVGYSACHWCHVMAHESFEDPETAQLMNELFVNIKVDREERPDIDSIYMEAVQAMTGHGGWPMTVFLTPDGRPFYGGTYFPPVPRYNMPSFRQLLSAIAEAWRDRRRELVTAGERLAEVLNRSSFLSLGTTALDTAILDRAVERLLKNHDEHEGGFGSAPKFPQPMNLDFLLQHHTHKPSPSSLKAVVLTLKKMAFGGIYDQLGGGFHRYSTDDHWLVPHFEKMLYDNAQLSRTYLHAWQLTGEPLFRRVVEETLDYVLREMTSADGGFYSTQDADSEGQEGRFYLWTPAEIEQLLGKEDARLFNGYFGVTPRGNFHEGGPAANILHVRREASFVAADLEMPVDRLGQVIARGRATLFEARERRVRPGRDDKMLAEWNGLMLHAFAEAGAALERTDYIAAAERAAEFILTKMSTAGHAPERQGSDAADAGERTSPGEVRLYRTYKDGRAHLNAYLEDYAAVGLGLVALYEVTFDLRWLQAACDLEATVRNRFHDPKRGGFYQTADDHEKLIARRKDFVDSAVPSGNSLAAELLLRMSTLLGRDEYVTLVTGTLALMIDGMREQPAAFGRLLSALDLYLNPGFEIAMVGNPLAPDTRALLAEVYRRFLPSGVLALREPADERAPALMPLLAGRSAIDGKPTAYVCRNFVCNLPVTEPEALARQLG